MASGESVTRPEPPVVFAALDRMGAGGEAPPGIRTSDRPGSFFGYFENEHGEWLIFEYDPERGSGQVYQQDFGSRAFPLIEGNAVGLTLNPLERSWLGVCLEAATRHRRPA